MKNEKSKERFVRLVEAIRSEREMAQAERVIQSGIQLKAVTEGETRKVKVSIPIPALRA